MTRRHRGPREASVPEVRSSAAPRDRRRRRFRSIRGPRTSIMRHQQWRSPAIGLTWRPTTATMLIATIIMLATRLAVTITIMSGTTAPNERYISKNEEKPRRRRGFHPRVRQHSGKFYFPFYMFYFAYIFLFYICVCILFYMYCLLFFLHIFLYYI